MIFKTLYIFSSNEKKAKVIHFSEGKNMITSSPIDGTDRGKSIIMKSLYHTLGGDCFFDDKWNDSDKTYIIKFTIDSQDYYIYRNNKLFKAFDNKLNLLFKVVERRELAIELRNIFNFAVQLPAREEEKLEITPPVYNYILYFLDQDKLAGPNFASFNNLAQYPNYKENVLYYHFGVFDEEYYNIIRELERLKDSTQELTKQQELSNEMFSRVIENINGVSYTKNLDLLKKDVARSKEQYSIIASTLSRIRHKLIELRNEKEDLLTALNSLDVIDKMNEKQITSLNHHICPYCKSQLEETLDLRLAKYNTADDIVLLSNDMQISIGEIDRKINKQENLYKEWLAKLNEYDASLNEKSDEINDILTHRGYIEIRDSLINELDDIKKQLEENVQSEKMLKKREKEYADIKEKINKRYYELMLQDKNQFGLEEIDANSFEKITKTFSAGGSNKPISTVIWYINLIKIKNEFNPSALCFPIVFDSPNNAETDLDKKIQVYKYLVDNVDEKNQLIVSGIGYDKKDFTGVDFDKVITLDNEKYELLCDMDYQENVEFLRELCRK